MSNSNNGTVTLTRALISGNMAAHGAEVYMVSGILTANNFNLLGHSGLTNAQAFTGFTPTGTDLTATSGGTIPTALADILAPLATNSGPTPTHALVAGSPAIDASPADRDCQATDQRVVTRPQGAACDVGAFEFGGVPVHDLALTDIVPPKTVTLTTEAPTQTKRVKVQIQNRSPHSETIARLDTLVSLTVDSLGSCADLDTVIHVGPPQRPLPVTLKPKQKLSVVFDVTFACVNDPLKSTGKVAHDDYAYRATVNHAALDGQADMHPEDDTCPRAALGIDPNPDGKLKDTGCAKKRTDVVDER